MAEYTLVLTGGRAGQTVVLGGHQFVHGKTIVRGDPGTVNGVLTYLGRSWKAFPEGTAELTYHQEIDRGERDYATGAKLGGSDQVQDAVSSGLSATATLSPDDGGGADDDAPGSAGSVPGGDGHPNTGNDRQTTDADRVLKAIEALDPANDEHWTQERLPRLDAVAAASGLSNVTRAKVEQAKPGFKRGS